MNSTISKALETISKEAERLQALANDAAPSFSALKPYPNSSNVGVNFRPDGRDTSWSSYGAGWVPSVFFERYVSSGMSAELLREKCEEVLKQYDDNCARYWAAVQDVREFNQELVDNNERAFEAVKRFMSKVGINEVQYVEQKKTPRSTKTVTVKQPAAYITEIKSKYSFTDSEFERVVKCFADKRKELEKHAAGLIKAAAEREIAARNAEREQAELKAHVELCVRLGVSTDTEASELLELIGTDDKYFQLAAAMQATRNDWNDGCYRVEDALGKFVIADSEDKEIFESLSELCEDFEDGRVFRDCKWNYSVLFGMSAEESLELYKLWSIAHN